MADVQYMARRKGMRHESSMRPARGGESPSLCLTQDAFIFLGLSRTLPSYGIFAVGVDGEQKRLPRPSPPMDFCHENSFQEVSFLTIC